MQNQCRRQFLASTAAAGLIGLAPGLLVSGRTALAAPLATIRIGTRIIEVSARPPPSSG